MKILICEDHTLVRQNMKSMLELTLSDCMVSEAANGVQTLEMLAANPVDIVVLDLHLPDMHGLMVLEKIVARWPKIKVLVLSADSYEESAVQAIHKGARCYLNKDINPDIFCEALETLYKGRKYILPEVEDLLAKPNNNAASDELHKKLSKREYDVMILLAKEIPYKLIAGNLHISINA